ncbi:MAG: hypothetical protein M1835_003871, partial [Candelina submexicana]
SYIRYKGIGKGGFLGEGGNAKVYLVKKSANGKLLAEKNVRHLQDEEAYELTILKDVLKTSNERICNLRDFAEAIPQSEKRTASGLPFSMTPIYLDFCECGDLWDMLNSYREHGAIIPESFIFHVFQQVSEALAFLHWGCDVTGSSTPRKNPAWRQILHRDVKSENVFMTYRGDYTKRYPDIVLGDFGWATPSDWEDQMLRENVGTPCYRAPEMCYSKPIYTTKGDVWGLGTVIHALCTLGRAPIMSYPDGMVWGSDRHEYWDSHPMKREVQDVTGLGYSNKLDQCMRKALAFHRFVRLDSLELLEYIKTQLSKKPSVPFEDLDEWAVKVPDFMLPRENKVIAREPVGGSSSNGFTDVDISAPVLVEAA